MTLLSKNNYFVKTGGRFFQILWPSHNIWTLPSRFFIYTNEKKNRISTFFHLQKWKKCPAYTFIINIIFSPIFVANKTNVVYFNLNGPWKPRRQILNSGILWLEFWRIYKWLYLFRKTNYPYISKAHLASIIRNSKVCNRRP